MMTTRRRPNKRRPLTGFASRSPLHALIASLIRIALLVGVSVLGYMVIVNVLAPGLVETLVRQAQTR